MRQRSWLLAVVLIVSGSSIAFGQMTSQDARSQGDDLAKTLRDTTSGTILGDGAQDDVPGYGGTEFTESALGDDADALTDAGEVQRTANPSYSTIIDLDRPEFDPTTIDLSASEAIEKDPDSFLGNDGGFGADTGECTALPDSPTGTSEYLESCNEGSSPYSEEAICRIPLVVVVDNKGDPGWRYECDAAETIPDNTPWQCGTLHAADTGGTCVKVGESTTNDRQICHQYGQFGCTEPDTMPTEIYECSEEINFPGGIPFGGAEITDEYADDGQCASAADNPDCSVVTETCIDAFPATREVNGLSLTRSCWEWERTYSCEGIQPANDCGELQARADCVFDHDECLSEDTSGTCNVFDKWYRCTVGAPGVPSPPQYICGGDLYCINGECSEVERQASTEFKDAMVAVQTLGELRDDFDPDTLRLFTGDNLKCTKKLFGFSNCCSGKGVPIVTPFICSPEDRLVDVKDDEGLCHYVGSYCSDKVLGVCVTKKQSYCCFTSKLTRIIQEQGRPQIGKDWGTPKSTNCEGFLVEEFQLLDLSVMDFSEVYAEFVEAARLPDEIEATILIQEKIADYYEQHSGS